MLVIKQNTENPQLVRVVWEAQCGHHDRFMRMIESNPVYAINQIIVSWLI